MNGYRNNSCCHPYPTHGHPTRFNEEGWINATDVAVKFEKEVTNWLYLLDTLEYLVALSNKVYGKTCTMQEIS
ncbi:KilA-N domain-containing protein [Xenorhabdus griffiniae]|uniref:KilA-N domain-containing protein n=1 Tax=Xenorhabdus griffiniae TaxID=351672 RepID=UPI00308100D5